jgi:hypothetical protein
LRSSIAFTSPTGTQFTALWSGDEIELQKRVGRFEIPEVQGTRFQPMGAAALSYPLTLYFEGDSHDVEALRFVTALQAHDVPPEWSVTHPVYGVLSLVPISAKLASDPVGSANVTRVETQWIEPGPAATLVPVPALGGQIQALAASVDAASLASFVEQAASVDPAAVASLATTATAAVGIIHASPVQTLLSTVGTVRAGLDQAYAMITAAITSPVMDLVALGTGIQGILALPAQIAADLPQRLAGMLSMVEGLVTSFIPASGEEARTAAVMTEITLVAAVSGMGRCVATGTPKTREQAMTGISQMAAALNGVTACLDGAQTQQGGAYFSASATWADLARLVAMVQAMLLALLFDLRVAKRFALDRPRTPIDITIAEYGGLGAADANLDLFLYTNALRDRDVLILPAGREVVVYV